MSRRNEDPERLRTGREFIAYAERRGCTVRHGRHAYVTAPNGRGCPIPTHPGDLPTGTRRSILKMFAHMGLLALVLAVAIQFI